jgi:hypothetical protein
MDEEKSISKHNEIPDILLNYKKENPFYIFS